METRNSLLAQILECGYLDIDFLMDLCENNDLDIDVDGIRSNYGKLDVNVLIYESIRIIAEMFIDEYREEISLILELQFDGALEDYMSYHDIYEIYVNYMDSHLWFFNDKIQTLFEKSKYQV